MSRQDSIRGGVLHPLTPAVLFVVLSLAIGEFYPFSNFPMYGNPTPLPRDYYYVTDGADSPIRILNSTGITASKVKKIYNSRLARYRKDHGVKKKRDITPQHREEVGQEVLAYLRSLSPDGLPDQLKLVRVLIHTDESTGADGGRIVGLREETMVVAIENLP